jgi:hypothetical protein
MGRNMKIVNPPGDSWMSFAAKPFAKKLSNSLPLIFPDHRLVLVNIAPDALCECLSATRSFTNLFILGLLSLQSFAESRSKSFAASGASRDSMDFFLSSLASLLRWEAVIAVRFFIMTELSFSSFPGSRLPLGLDLCLALCLASDLGLLEADLDLDLVLLVGDLDLDLDSGDLDLDRDTDCNSDLDLDPDRDLNLGPGLGSGLGDFRLFLGLDLLDELYELGSELSGGEPLPLRLVGPRLDRGVFSPSSFSCTRLVCRLGLLCSGSSLFMTSWALLSKSSEDGASVVETFDAQRLSIDQRNSISWWICSGSSLSSEQAETAFITSMAIFPARWGLLASKFSSSISKILGWIQNV